MEANRNQTGCLKTTLILVGVSVIFIGLVIVVADIKCGYDIENWWAPLYPNGETVKVDYDLFRPRALGETFWYMESADDIETVKQFYRDTRLDTLDSGKTRGIANSESAVRPLEDAIASARAQYESIAQELEAEKAQALGWLSTLEQLQEDGRRSLIILYSTCGT